MILKNIKELIDNSPFKMIVEEEQIYMTQFKRMNLLEENHIFITTSHKRIHIYGKDLKMKKLINQEILLTGEIHKIEVEDAE